MLFNKSQFKVANNKKLLRKIGKKWVTVSALTLVLLGGGALISSATTHADTTIPAVEAKETNNVKKQINSNLDKAYQMKNNTQSGKGDSVSSAKDSSNSASASKPSSIQFKATNMYRGLMMNATNVSRNNNQSSTSAYQSQENTNQRSLTKPNNNVNIQKSNQPLSKVAMPNHFNSHNLGDTNTVTDTITFHDIYGNVDMIGRADSVSAPGSETLTGNVNDKYTISAPKGWAIVNPNGSIANGTNNIKNDSKTFKYSQGNQTINLAPEYDGLTYKYTYKYNDSSVEFTGGTAESDLSTFTSDAPSMDTVFQSDSDINRIIVSPIYAEYIKFDDSVDTSHVTNMSNMFNLQESVKSLDFGNNFDTSHVTNMSGMFHDAMGLTAINFGPKFDTSHVTNMSEMFCSDSGLQSLNLGNNFDTSHVTNMSEMFSGVRKLKNLDLGNKFNTSKVTNMSDMFSYDSNLISLTLPKVFDTSKVTNMSDMFYSVDYGDNNDNFTLTVQSPKTKLASNIGASFYPTFTYHRKVLKDKNGKPYTSFTATDFSKGNKVGTYAIWPNEAPHYDSMYYLYSPSDNSVTFYYGTANPNKDKFNFSNAYNSDDNYDDENVRYSDISNVNIVRFGSDTDVSKLTDMSNMFSDKYSPMRYSGERNNQIGNSLHVIDLGNNFDTSNTTNMNGMFGDNTGLNTVIFSPNFDTSKVTNMNHIFGIPDDKANYNQVNLNHYKMNPSIQKLIIKSPKTKFKDGYYDNGNYINDVTKLGVFYKQLLGKSPSGKPYTLPMANDFTKGNVGTFIKDRNVPTDTIDYMYNGKQLATQSFDGSNYLNQDQSGYRSLDNHDLTAIPSDFRFTSNNTIALDDSTHKVNIQPVQATDKIYYTNANGKQIPDTTPITITGNSNSVKSASDTSITDSQFASQHKLPTGYHLVNPDESIGYDGSSHNIAIAPDRATDTINYQVNGITKGSHQFTGNDVNAQGASDTNFTIGNKPSDLPANYHVINPNQSFNYDGGTHDVAIGFTPSYLNVIEYIDNNGSDVGNTSAYGQEGTDVPNKVIEDDVPKDYQLSPNQTLPVQFTKDNVIKVAVQNNDNKNSDMVVGTAYLTLLYKKGTRTDGQVLRLHINGNIGDSDIVINPQDYDKPGYQVSTTKDWHISFKYSDVTKFTHDFSRYNRENTFVYQANPINIDIKYIDTQTNKSVNKSDTVLSDVAYDGDTADLQGTDDDNNILSVDGHEYHLNLPNGYHLAHSNNYIKVTANGTYVKPVTTVGGTHMLRMPLMKLTLGITPHFNKHTTKPASSSSVTPVKPSSASSVTPSSANSIQPSSASTAPSSVAPSSASQSTMPSSMASVMPIVLPSSEASSTSKPSSVAPASEAKKPSSASASLASNVATKPVVKPTTHKNTIKHSEAKLNHSISKATHQLNTVERHMKARKATETKMAKKLVHAKKTIKRSQHKLTYLRHNKRHVAHALRRITRNKMAIKHAKRVIHSVKAHQAKRVTESKVTSTKPVTKSIKNSVNIPKAKPSSANQSTVTKKLPQTGDDSYAGLMALILMVASAILAGFGKLFDRKRTE